MFFITFSTQNRTKNYGFYLISDEKQKTGMHIMKMSYINTCWAMLIIDYLMNMMIKFLYSKYKY